MGRGVEDAAGRARPTNRAGEARAAIATRGGASDDDDIASAAANEPKRGGRMVDDGGGCATRLCRETNEV